MKPRVYSTCLSQDSKTLSKQYVLSSTQANNHGWFGTSTNGRNGETSKCQTTLALNTFLWAVAPKCLTSGFYVVIWVLKLSSCMRGHQWHSSWNPCLLTRVSNTSRLRERETAENEKENQVHQGVDPHCTKHAIGTVTTSGVPIIP